MSKLLGRACLSVATVVALASGAAAQDYLAGPGVTGDQQQPKKDSQFTLLWTVESWETELEITDSSNNFGASASEIEDSIDARTGSNGLLLTGKYTYSGWASSVLSAHLSLGIERLATNFEIGPGNVEFGDPLGDQDLDAQYDMSFVWALGANFRYNLEKWDIGGGFEYRSGGSDRDDVAQGDQEYDYTSFQIRFEAGWRATEGVRPFIALRYTLYEGEYENQEIGGPDNFTYDLELDQAFGVVLGTAFESGSLAGAIELRLVDSIGFVASVGWKF